MKSLEISDTEAASVQKTPNRVTLDSIKGAIVETEYFHPALCPHMTVAFVRMMNGFVVLGQSAPADPANFDAELGKRFALEDAIRRIWPLEGYALRERLAEQERAQ